LPFAAIYCFKKALFLINAIVIRFGAKSERDPASFPIPHTLRLPVFADNVLPSILIHLGVIDLSTATWASSASAPASASSLALASLFPAIHGAAAVAAAGNLNIAAAADPALSLLVTNSQQQQPSSSARITIADPVITFNEGPILTPAQSYVLRAAAIEACERTVSHAHAMSAAGRGAAWLKDLTLPDLDTWLWAIAKDRPDYRALPRFVVRDTPYF
jgi:hypothetical protein